MHEIPWDRLAEAAVTIGGVMVASYKSNMRAHDKRVEADVKRSVDLQAHLKRQDDHMERQDATLDTASAGITKAAELFGEHVAEDKREFTAVRKSITALGRRLPKAVKEEK